MATPSRTWWGQRFLEALAAFTDPRRLQRGRGYTTGRMESWQMDHNGRITAEIRGSVNPYFGVYQAPLYTTTVRLEPLSARQWQQVIEHLGSRAGPLSQLLNDEMPSSVESSLDELGISLLPSARQDFDNHCTCPDTALPCKHIAAVYYRLAEQLDADPLLLFVLRGMPRDALRQALTETPLGEALAQSLTHRDEPAEPPPVASLYTRPLPLAADAPVTYARFWGQGKALPQPAEAAAPAVSAALIRRAGDHPGFWDSERSFVAVMEEVYGRVRKAYRGAL